jgi:hypothetical protein
LERDQSQAVRFAALFAGNVRCHGSYTNVSTERADGKLTGKAHTVFAPVTQALYEQHLAGSGLGIVPIKDDSTCSFGAIDIDVYADLDHAVLAAGIKKMSLPLMVCRSKSGGAHLYLFMKSPVPAAKVRSYLAEVAAAIGHPKAEVFPKQTFIEADNPESCGSWINLPFCGGEATTRYGVSPDGNVMTLADFLNCAETSKVDVGLLSKPVSVSPDFQDGPPCLQALAASGGCPAGSRNNGLFAMGVYLRKAHPDNYSSLLEQYNQRYMQPPLQAEELVQIKKSVGKKVYNYRCGEEPIVSFCNAGACRLRKFGVGGSSSPMPQFGALKKLETDPPSYTWEIDGKVLGLSPDEMLSYAAFSRAVFMRLNKLLPPLKPAQWRETLQSALETMESVPMPEDASPDGQLWEQVKRFCNSSGHATELDEVLELGRIYKADGIFYTRIADITQYLHRQHFKAPPVQEIAASLRRHGGKHLAKKLRGQSVNLWLLPAAGIETSQEPLKVPDALLNGSEHLY